MRAEPVMTHPSPSLRNFTRDVRGAVSTEYVVLVGTVGLAIAFALVAVGPQLVHAYERTRDMIASPFP
jgi:Flp pilus assembly pilin Flp